MQLTVIVYLKYPFFYHSSHRARRKVQRAAPAHHRPVRHHHRRHPRPRHHRHQTRTLRTPRAAPHMPPPMTRMLPLQLLVNYRYMPK